MKILDIVIDIRQQVHVNAKRIDSTTVMLAEVLTKETGLEDELHDLPFTELHSFLEFDKKLTEDADFFKKYVMLLSSVGGSGYDDTARNILKRLLTTGVCLNFNWIGVMGKKAFRELKTVHLVVGTITIIFCVQIFSFVCSEFFHFIAATQKYKSKKHCTETRIISSIKSWVRNVGDRSGGRDRRRRATVGFGNQQTNESDVQVHSSDENE